jgi:hypothetical protein
MTPALRLSQTTAAGTALKYSKGPDVSGGPVRHLLRRTGLGVREVAGAQHRDEELGLGDLPGLGIMDGQGVASEVDEELVAGPKLLAHDNVDALLPAPERSQNWGYW